MAIFIGKTCINEREREREKERVNEERERVNEVGGKREKE